MKAKVALVLSAATLVGAGTVVAVGPWLHPHGSPKESRVASDREPTAPATSAGAGDAVHARRYVAGTHRVLHVETRHRTELGQGGGRVPQIEIGLEGDLDLAYVEAEGEGARLRGKLREPTVRGRDGEGRVLDPVRLGAVARELDTPFYFTVDAQGRVRTLAVGKSTEALARGLVRTVVATLQVVEKAGPSWTAEEEDGTGEYRARYTREADHTLAKTKLEYLRVATARGLLPASAVGTVAVKSHARITLDDAGWPTQVDAEDAQTVDFDRGIASAATTGTVRVRLVSADPDFSVLGRYAQERDGLAEVGLSSTTELADAERQSDVALVGGAGLGELVTDLRGAAGDEARAHTLARLSALHRLEPASAKDVLARLQGESVETQDALLAALGGAGTEEAQEALLTAMQSTRLPEASRASAAMALGLSTPPSPHVTEGLMGSLAQSRGEVRSVASLALGGMARNLATDHPDVAAAAVALLGQQLARTEDTSELVVVLRALGNTGDPAVLPHAERALGHADAVVRMAAVGALRFVAAPAADELIARTLAEDTDMDVREEAAEATGYRPIELHLAALEVALGKEPMTQVRLEIVRVLVQKAKASPRAAAVLARVAETDASPEVRALATQGRVL